MQKVHFIRQTVVAAFVVAAISFAGCKKDKDPDPVSVSGVSLNNPTFALVEGGSNPHGNRGSRKRRKQSRNVEQQRCGGGLR